MQDLDINLDIKQDADIYNKTLRIHEMFYSLQGESSFVGIPTVFIRLTGCPLRCNYCDTAYAFKGGDIKKISDILSYVKKFNVQNITITGGEPLAQKNVLALMKVLCDLNYIVSIETSGALDISKIDHRVIKVMDIKTPDSGESHRNLLSNLNYLSNKDELKFVICSYQDYLWSKNFIIDNKLTNNLINDLTNKLTTKPNILFSPSFGEINPTDLAEWILADNLLVRFQFQLHKFLWGEQQGK